MSKELNTVSTPGECLLVAVKLFKNADPDKRKYSGYGIGFDARLKCLLGNGKWGKKNVNLKVDDCCSVYADNRKKWDKQTVGLDDAMAPEA